MTTKTAVILIFILAVLMFGVGLYSYPRLGEQVITHWGPQGEPNGYGSRFTGAFLLPLMAFGLGLLMLGIPEIDPLKKNILLFRKDYNGFIVVFMVFFLYLHLVTMLINLGAQLNLNRMLVPGLGVFLFYAGVLIGKARRNFFIGIRTPWTLSSDTVWQKTHQLGGVLFKVVGIITVLGFFVPNYAFLLLLVPLLLVSVFVTVYSYVEFRRETSSNS